MNFYIFLQSNLNNFLILLVDMEDSKTFDKVLRENKKEALFKDFTYFPDTLSAYPFTRESIPYIFSGNWYEAQTSFADYYNEAMNKAESALCYVRSTYDVSVTAKKYLDLYF